MKLERDVTKDATFGVAAVKRLQDLSTISEPGCAAVIWDRRMTSRFQTWIDHLPLEQWPQGKMTFQAALARQVVAELIDKNGPSLSGEGAVLADDIASICEVFAGVMKSPFLRLRMEVVITDACRKFHLDAIAARLICTYRGEGTQYGVATDDGGPAHIASVPTGAPAIFRGSDWPGAARAALLHRSPPIERSGRPRFVMVIDPVTKRDAGV